MEPFLKHVDSRADGQPVGSLDGFGYSDPEHFGDTSAQRFLK